MSDLFEKLSQPTETHSGLAEATREQLLDRYGVQEIDKNHIAIRYTGHSELWERAIGSGLSARFRQVERDGIPGGEENGKVSEG